MNISRPLAECLLKLRNLDDFRPLREYLESELKMHVDRMVMCNDDRQMVLAQGSVRALNALTNLIDGSAAILDKERRS